MLTLTFHGHACFTLEADARRVIIDPFLTGSPATDIPLARLPTLTPFPDEARRLRLW